MHTDGHSLQMNDFLLETEDVIYSPTKKDIGSVILQALFMQQWHILFSCHCVGSVECPHRDLSCQKLRAA